MAQGVALGRVRDDEHAFAVELARDVVEEGAHLLCAVPIALTAWVRFVDEPASRLELLDRRAVQLAVVALAQTHVPPDLDFSPLEGDLGGLESTAKVGREDAGDPVVVPPPPKVQREPPTLGRELTR